jgi:hypothetical protein
MFAKLARFHGLGRRRAASAVVAMHCNDNHPAVRLATVTRRAQRPVLACGWRRAAATGRLECFWQDLPADAEAVEEPGPSWLIGGVRALLGRSVPALASNW